MNTVSIVCPHFNLRLFTLVQWDMAGKAALSKNLELCHKEKQLGDDLENGKEKTSIAENFVLKMESNSMTCSSKTQTYPYCHCIVVTWISCSLI